MNPTQKNPKYTDPDHPDNHGINPKLLEYLEKCKLAGIEPDAREMAKYLP